MKAFYAGSFDPFTIGHLSIAERALKIFDYLVIGVGINSLKKSGTCFEERIEKIKEIFANKADKISVIGYEGLTAVAARDCGCGVLVRGVRNSIDFEHEKELADINLKVLDMPTVMIPADPDLGYVSSSMVRELAHFGFNPDHFIADKHEDKH